jgi:altronate dehydratase large subunit
MTRSASFLGYPRPDGRVGIRNRVLIMAINGLVAPAAGRIAAAVRPALLVTSPYGRGQFGADKRAHAQQLIGLGRNPNVAAVLIVGADRMTADAMAEQIRTSGKPTEVVALDDVQEDALALSLQGIRAAARLVRNASRQRREARAVSSLFVGVECGHSDATSGLVANPLAGKVVDRLIDAGGTAVIGETLEWLGAEHLLARRAATPAVAEAITAAVQRREAAISASGVDPFHDNPGAENIRGGLSSIEEKSLGAIAKGGTRPIDGVLALAEAPARAGLYFMDAPFFSPESLTGFAAAGAQVMLFTTGAGNSFCSAVAPTIKISAKPETLARLGEQIDFDASPAFSGTEDLDHAADRLFSLLLDVASGFRTWGEILSESSESIARIGGSL